MELKIPAFGEQKFDDNMSNNNTRSVKISECEKESFEAYCRMFIKNGMELKESRFSDFQSYAAFFLDGTGVFVNYFANIKEMTIVTEINCNYFSYHDRFITKNLSPQITQVHLEDFGMSYAIRLSDGRFIIIDGGWNFKADAKELMRVLKAGTPDEKPVVAAWIMTHAHCDHFRCFNTFTELFFGEFTVEKFMLNFPEPEKYPNEIFARYPHIKDDYSFENTSCCAHMKMMYENFKKLGSEFYMLHTGQTYRIGDAEIEMLACIDDTVDHLENSNSESIIFKMKLGGQIVLWTGDASFSNVKLADKYGDYLKSDILQVPHHGFGSGTAIEQIKGYERIKPSVCMLPVSGYNAYTEFDMYVEGSRHLMTKTGIDELITGDVSTTITLPYTAPAYKREELRKNCEKGLANAGSTCWIFMGLNTGSPEDFIFDVLGNRAPIYVELLGCNIRGIRINPTSVYRTVNITDENDVDLNPFYFSWNSIEKLGLPENTSFAARFLSDEPFVVSHKTHTPSYKA